MKKELNKIIFLETALKKIKLYLKRNANLDDRKMRFQNKAENILEKQNIPKFKYGLLVVPKTQIKYVGDKYYTFKNRNRAYRIAYRIWHNSLNNTEEPLKDIFSALVSKYGFIYLQKGFGDEQKLIVEFSWGIDEQYVFEYILPQIKNFRKVTFIDTNKNKYITYEYPKDKEEILDYLYSISY